MSITHSESWQERTAILQHEGNIPEALAGAAAVVFCLNPPDGIDPQGWKQMQDILGRGLDEHYNMLEGRI